MKFIPTFGSGFLPVFSPVLFSGMGTIAKLTESADEVKDARSQFARVTKEGSLTDVCTELDKPLSGRSASRILNRGRSAWGRAPYERYEDRPAIPLAEDPMSHMNSSRYVLHTLKISMKQFQELVEAAAR
jgi:hypothetical protein